MTDTTEMNDIKRIKQIKHVFFENAYKKYLGHLPSALSCLEILYVLYNKCAKIDEYNYKSINRDKVIISKEHSRFAQVCVLYEKGLVPFDVIENYMTDGGLAGHDMFNFVGTDKIAAIDIASGSLGLGLSVGVGLALANKNNNIYVVVGDGELQEGSCWEALMFIGQNKLKNLIVVIDCNREQIDDYTKNIINTTEFAPSAIKQFGFDVIECDGHNIIDLEQALNKENTDLPRCVIANTIKGKELRFMQENLGCAYFHWQFMQKKDYERAIKGI